METLAKISWLIPLLPLLGAAAVGALGKKTLKGQSHLPIWATVGTSAVLSLMMLFSMMMAPADKTVSNSATFDKLLPEVERAAVEGHHGDDHADESHADEAHADEDHADEQMSGAHADDAAGEDGHHGYDPHVKGFASNWFTWIASGNSDEAGEQPGESDARGIIGGYFEVAAGAWIDPLTVIMLSVVCGIGFFITVFAAGYMKGETGYWRFFAYLGLFLFAMTILVMGDNLIMLYLGWEGVGLCSYLLIGYYYDKPAAREAAKKAFLVNRIGDFGFAIGIMLIFYCFGTVSYFGDGVGTGTGFVEMMANYHEYVPADRQHLLNWIPFALMLGAFGKSAQFPLYVWLPDAMEGPTPVSALIHAATMVTAGVYMIARLNPIFNHVPAALVTIAVVGAFTACFAATIGLRQFDLKKVFAYSTVSQLGYMFVGIACLAPTAAVFHLVTHAFFKALLFLSSGVVMHAMLGHLDMRKMSGLKRELPKTRWLILAGCLALAGFPGTSGFFSKDEIIHFAHHHAGGDFVGYLLWFVLLATAFMTAYYTFRLYFRVFEGETVVPSEPHPDHHHEEPHDAPGQTHVENTADTHHAAGDHAHDHGHHDHEPSIMIIPLVVLAIGALLAGFFNFPGFHNLSHFLGDSPSIAYGFDMAVQTFGSAPMKPDPAAFGYEPRGFFASLMTAVPGLIIGTIIALAGIGLAYYLHLVDRGRAASLAHTLRPIATVLDHKYWVDEIYNKVIVGTLRTLGKIFGFVDDNLVDGAGVEGGGRVPWLTGNVLVQSTQRGRLGGYSLFMLLGISIILLVLFW